MTTHLQKGESIDQAQKKLELLKSCLQLMQIKTHLLMQNNLEGLEKSLVFEADMLDQLGQIRVDSVELSMLGEEEYPQWVAFRNEMEEVAKEMQFANLTNATLIQNGLQFAEVLYRAVCPPQTYSPLLQVTLRPVESVFQVRY